MFEINNDLNRLRFDIHNAGHLIGSFVFALLWGFWVSYALWLLWELFDGFKPWYYTYKPLPDKPAAVNWFRQNFLYSDKFSLQDALVWDLGGAAAAQVIIFLWSDGPFPLFPLY